MGSNWCRLPYRWSRVQSSKVVSVVSNGRWRNFENNLSFTLSYFHSSQIPLKPFPSFHRFQITSFEGAPLTAFPCERFLQKGARMKVNERPCPSCCLIFSLEVRAMPSSQTSHWRRTKFKVQWLLVSVTRLCMKSVFSHQIHVGCQTLRWTWIWLSGY